MLYPKSKLDLAQIIKLVFDEPNQRLRTESIVVFDGAQEVIINQNDDSIAIGDGTNLFTSTTVGADVGLDVNIIGGSINTTTSGLSFLANVNAVSANTEYSYAFPDNTSQFIVRARLGQLKIAYNSGESGTTYMTLRKGCIYTIDQVLLVDTNIYFQSSVPNDVIEIQGWYSA